MDGNVFIGTSGWSYLHWWNGVFYPQEVKQNKWLEWYARYFNAVEINSTFYRIPQEKTIENWRRRVPENFTFVIKASRIITHLKKMSDIDDTLKKFLDVCAGFKEKLGPLLFQTPPSVSINADNLINLLDTIATHQPAKTIDVVLEFRNKSWFCQEIFEILKRYNAALCFSDMPEFAIDKPETANFIYVRRHGQGRDTPRFMPMKR